MMDVYTLRYGLFVFVTLALTAFITYGAYSTSRLLREWQPDGNLLLLPSENLVRWVLITACIALGWLSGLPPEQLGWTWAHVGRQIGLGALLGVALALFFYAATRRLIQRTGRRYYSDQILAYIIPTNRRQLVGVALAMVGVALLEELLFRSLLLGGLLPILPAWLLLIVLAALFGAMHSPQGVWGMVGAGGAGLCFGLLFLWSGSLLLPLTAHYVTNMSQVAIVMRSE